ncbi:hypothetical protein LX81_00402 [Palleronia aestuarii]|uniref:ABC transporter permease n=1 Tax=Palleronia aestuarii TaxID=568105 RepID=A0A2W7NI43_9RHOB|nr:hypothetical protein [Palleronia aestuarii]PZX19938.1 hypothetical protein LX81_00402 [Palleronia aestuarii]
MTPFWLLRAKRWAAHPPSAGRVALVLAVIAVCLLLYAVDRFVGWPEWLTPDRAHRVPR